MEHDLTPREWQVADLVAKGRRDKQIAAELGLSVYTVHAYTQKIRIKLGVSNRVELAMAVASRREGNGRHEDG